MSEQTNDLTAKGFSEDQIFEIDPTTVTVKEELPRHRKELGDIAELVASFEKFGQILPIIINRDNELIAGGRRLAACLMSGRKARVCYKDTVDPLFMRELELEENVRRKSLTPSEEVFAIRDLHELKQKIHGESGSGRTGGHTIDDTAKIIGKTRSVVIEAIQLADAISMFPTLATCTTKSEIKKAVKGLERAQTQIAALASYEEKLSRSKEFVLVNKPAEKYLEGIPTGSIDLFFTDPPYGINVHELAMTIGGHTGGDLTTTGTEYDDSEDYAKTLLEKLCVESYRVTKETGHALVFCAPSIFPWLSERMGAAGWLVAPRPVVWIKRETGQNNCPDKWFSAAYEFVLFARKPSSCLVLQGRPDWIQADPVLPSERVHQAEKPVNLCKELISRVCLPGQYMLDCCMGSGALVEAGVRMKLMCLGSELDITSYASAAARLSGIVSETSKNDI